MTSILTLIKRWWRNHKWVNTSEYYVLPKKYEVFWLNEKQIRKVEDYKSAHKSMFYQYRFTPGPIGVACSICCKDCKCIMDITDFDTW